MKDDLNTNVIVDESDAAFERLMDATQTLIQLKVGDVLTQEMIDDLHLVDKDHRETAAEVLSVQTGLVEMMSRDNVKMREAGCNLAEAAGRAVRDYDGLHRLSIAISAWYAAISGEGDRDTRHAQTTTEDHSQ